MNNKYYFVSYRWKNYDRKISDWQYSNTVIDVHPILWLKETVINKIDYQDTYQIEFYKEIPKEVFNEVSRWIDCFQ